MNELTVIDNVRGYVDEKGTVWLDLEDVSRGLGFTQEKNGIEYVRWETVRRYLAEYGFSQQVGKEPFIPENIFYLLAMKANNETAITFQKKVAYEIMPSIRKTGVYIAPQIDSKMLYQIAQALEEKEKQIALMKPKVEFFDAVANSKDAIDLGTAAKVLNMGIGRTRLFRTLREQKILNKDNIPYQEYIDRGYFRTIEQKYTKPDSTTCINIKTLVYQRGLDYIRKILTEKKAI